jgi:hypothetical protein
MAAATGVLTHELSKYVPQANMRIARISLDILGLIPLDDLLVPLAAFVLAKPSS